MNHETRQFVRRKEFKPVERKSTLYMKIENFDKFKENETIESKKIQFLDGDDVWWMSVRVREETELTFVFEASDVTWKSGIWSYSVSGTFNGSGRSRRIDVLLRKLNQKQSKSVAYIHAPFEVLELKLTMTISQAETSSVKLPIHKFIGSTVQYKKILSNNKDLLNEPKYSDFTFVVQGQKYHVHKNILAAASPVFDALFTTKFRENIANECNVNHIDPAIFQHLLNFIYFGELPKQLNELARYLYEVAHYYQIKELLQICVSVQRYHLSKDNAVDLYRWADTYDVEDLKKDAWNTIQSEILEIFEAVRPPSAFDAVQLMIQNKINKDKLLAQCRLKLSELNSATNELFK